MATLIDTSPPTFSPPPALPLHTNTTNTAGRSRGLRDDGRQGEGGKAAACRSRGCCGEPLGLHGASLLPQVRLCGNPLAQELDPIKVVADSLREKKGVPWTTAKYEGPDGDSTYVEYFRGKDFARYFRASPEKLNTLVPLKAGEARAGGSGGDRGAHLTGSAASACTAALILRLNMQRYCMDRN